MEPEQLLVRMRHLTYDDGGLALGVATKERIGSRIEGRSFIDTVEPGDQVDVHWRFACDRLTGEETARLERWTTWQLDAMRLR